LEEQVNKMFTLTFRESEFGPASTAEFQDFPHELWGIFSDFIRYSNSAHRTRFAKELSSYKTSFHIPNSGIIRNDGIVPDDEALSAFLHKYRPIILKNERTEFTNVCTHLIRHIENPTFTNVVKEWKREYSGKSIRDVCEIGQGDLLLTGESFLNTYLNAFEYHRDKKYRDKLATFQKSFAPEAQRGLVTLLLTFKFSAVCRLRKMIIQLQDLKREMK